MQQNNSTNENSNNNNAVNEDRDEESARYFADSSARYFNVPALVGSDDDEVAADLRNLPSIDTRNTQGASNRDDNVSQPRLNPSGEVGFVDDEFEEELAHEQSASDEENDRGDDSQLRQSSFGGRQSSFGKEYGNVLSYLSVLGKDTKIRGPLKVRSVPQKYVTINVNCEKINLIMQLVDVVKQCDGIVFGGCVRDLILRDFYKKKDIAKADKSSQKLHFHPGKHTFSVQGEGLVIPRDVDICVTDTKHFLSVFRKISKYNYDILKEVRGNDNKKYSSQPVAKFELCTYYFSMKNVGKVSIKVDILEPKRVSVALTDIFSEGAYCAPDFDVNGLYMDQSGLHVCENVLTFYKRNIDAYTESRFFFKENVLERIKKNIKRKVCISLAPKTFVFYQEECEKKVICMRRMKLVWRYLKMISNGWDAFHTNTEGLHSMGLRAQIFNETDVEEETKNVETKKVSKEDGNTGKEKEKVECPRTFEENQCVMCCIDINPGEIYFSATFVKQRLVAGVASLGTAWTKRKCLGKIV